MGPGGDGTGAGMGGSGGAPATATAIPSPRASSRATATNAPHISSAWGAAPLPYPPPEAWAEMDAVGGGLWVGTPSTPISRSAAETFHPAAFRRVVVLIHVVWYCTGVASGYICYNFSGHC